uniref:Uncharacterized protein n=1 Tax=Ditylenchus dipsaci TaxID=166011 RepID=A0A915CVQ9_9BILA
MSWIQRLTQKKEAEKDDAAVESSSKNSVSSSTKSSRKFHGDAAFPRKRKKKLKRKTQTTQNTVSMKSEDRGAHVLDQLLDPLPQKSVDKKRVSNPQSVKKNVANLQAVKKDKSNQPSSVAPLNTKRFSLRDKRDMGNKGHRHENPLIIGIPFWYKREKTEIGAEMIIDHELIDSVAAGTSGIKPKQTKQRTKFDSFTTMDRLQMSNDHFFRDNIIYATASSVLEMLLDPSEASKQKAPKPPLECDWADKVTIHEFHMKDRKFKGSSVHPFVEDLRGMAGK